MEANVASALVDDCKAMLERLSEEASCQRAEVKGLFCVRRQNASASCVFPRPPMLLSARTLATPGVLLDHHLRYRNELSNMLQTGADDGRGIINGRDGPREELCDCETVKT